LNQENENYIVTGSYDENMYFFDIRNFKQEIFKQKLGCSLWDIKQLDISKHKKKNFTDKKLFLISCIYEGFRIYSFETQKDNEKAENNLKLIVNKENGKENNHNAIVYGVDTYINLKSYVSNSEKDILVVSSSFYDNKIILWKI